MPLSSGARLGPYEIQSAIGAGGMGEVYKARDTRLDRTVAIKILPAELSADPDRRARFEREARAVAALSHPHICALFDIGEAALPRFESVAAEQRDGRIPSPESRTLSSVHYLVMEHLSGETLADRLIRGPIPLAQALDIAAQIAEALDAAHKHGIIHRDLKPGNVMLTTGGAGRSGVASAKLLDFGLAKLAAHGERPAVAPGAAFDSAQASEAPGLQRDTAPTRPAPLTAEGTIVGTLQYMAPEQLEGKEADARTDLWALGAILYEMLTGRRAFEGESQVSLIGNIMNAEPASLAALQPLTPPSLERVVTKCLAKHPDDRWDTAHDVADELRWITKTSGAGAPAGPRPRHRRGLWLAFAVTGGLATALAGAGVMWMLGPATTGVALTRPSLDVRPAEELNAGGVMPLWLATPAGSRTAIAWTPDGQALVFVGRRGGVQQLYVRRFDAAEARPLAGTDGAQVPAVSPDGKWVAFWAGGAIRKVPIDGGPAMDLVSGIENPPCGMAWDAGGRVYFGRYVGPIWQIPSDGPGAAVTTLGKAELAHGLPCPLPSGRALLYTVRKRQWSWGDEEVVAQTLATGERNVLLRDASDARYVPTGHLVFLRRGALFAVPFDAERLELQGAPVAILDTVVQALAAGNSSDVTGAGQFAIAPTGTLAWIPGPIAPHPQAALVTVDRRGQVAPLAAPVRSYMPFVRISPNGRQLAVVVLSLTEAGIWLYDLGRGTLTLLAGGGEVMWPVWAPDGRRIAFAWLKDGQESLAAQPADGTSAPQTLWSSAFLPSSWTADGRQLAGLLDGGISVATVQGDSVSARALFETPHDERWPTFSPDGRWLAYTSNVSGRDEVYVRPYPGPGPTEQVTIDGGMIPAWNPSGKELFFLSLLSPAGRRSMMAVEFQGGPPPHIGRPAALFDFDPADLRLYCEPIRCYDVAPGGQRFYAWQHRRTAPLPPVTHINLILNWFEELKAKVPATR